MRLSLAVAGLSLAAVILVAGGKTPAHAQTENTAPPAPRAIEEKKVEVKPGDYLEKIATQNNTTYPRLYDANTQIQDPDVIYAGDTLRIPRPDEHLERRPLPNDKPAATAEVTQSTAKPAAKPAAPKRKASSPAVSYSGDTSVWDRLAQCESGGNWSINTGNGYYGGLQFTLSTWRGVGGSGYPHQASRKEQIARAVQLQARSGWGQWPACASKLGLL